jgi:zinc/manganese transport system ATP-binding protein
MGATVTFDDLTLGYDGRPAVHHLSGSIDAGSLTAVVGPNGSGKSTLLKGILGILKPLGGRIVTTGIDRRGIAYLPQLSEIDRSFPATVLDLVALGLWSRRGAFRRIGPADRDEIAAALDAVGLSGFDDRGIDTLSGGQFQRALFARVLLQNAGLVLLDEPFNSVDSRTVEDLLAVVGRWRREGRTVLAVLHDLDLVRRHFPRTLLLARSPVAWGETHATLGPQNLREARRLNESWDEHAAWCERSEAA